VFLGEQFSTTWRASWGPADDGLTDAVDRAGRAILFGLFFAAVPARAGGLRAGARLPADPADRAAPVADHAGAGDLQRLQLLHPAGGAVLPADRQPDERRRHHRTGWCGCRASMVGHFPGGLAQVNVVLSFFFAGISGSSTADAASQSKIFIPAQRKEGYDDSFSVAITAVSSVLAVIIPPSILMIVWGGVLTVSIGALFLAGIIPGLLIALVQMATVHAYAKARGYPTYPRSTCEVPGQPVIAVPALMTPFIIIGGKVFGWFTRPSRPASPCSTRHVLSLSSIAKINL
jgi:hypothetical protein